MCGYIFKKIFFLTLLMLIYYKSNRKKHIFVVNFTSACSPHFNMRIPKPLLWPIFGNNDNDALEGYDKETERRSNWTTVGAANVYRTALILCN